MNIIHLSDLHLREKTRYETNNVLRTLTLDIENRVKEEGLDNIYVAITGDLTYSGKREEFELVKEFAAILNERIEIEKIFYCPGNHDLDWDMYSVSNSDLMEDLIVEGERGIRKAEERFKKSNDLEMLKSGMVHYYDFLKSVGQHYNEYLYSIYTTQKEKFKVNFIALNSAYLFSRKYPYYGYIGNFQIDHATNAANETAFLDEEIRVFNLTLVHHPFKAIVPSSQEATETKLKGRSNIILTGHVHSLSTYIDITASLAGSHTDKGNPVISSARCVYDEIDDPQVIPGYSIIGISFENSRVGHLKMYQFMYDKSKMVWYMDSRKSSSSFTINTEQETGQEGVLTKVASVRLGNLNDVTRWGWDRNKLVDALIKLDKETVGESKSMMDRLPERWGDILEQNPDTWRMLINESTREVVGYWHFVPLFPEDIRMAKDGLLDESEISVEKVVPMISKGRYDIYFLNIRMKKEYRGINWSKLLIESIFQSISDMAKNGIFIDEIVTNSYTGSAVAISKKFGLQPLKDHKERGKVYWRRFYPFSETDKVWLSEFPSIKEMYEKEFRS
ncbi:MAG: metallophosphoesterase family protein [Thermoplasmata archaeon]